MVGINVMNDEGEGGLSLTLMLTSCASAAVPKYTQLEHGQSCLLLGSMP